LRQKGDLTRIQQGVIPAKYRERIDAAVKAKAEAEAPSAPAKAEGEAPSAPAKVTGVEDDFTQTVPDDTVVMMIDENGDEVMVSFKQAIEAVDAEHAETYQALDRALSCFYGR
jgi:hypothetical protein